MNNNTRHFSLRSGPLIMDMGSFQRAVTQGKGILTSFPNIESLFVFQGITEVQNEIFRHLLDPSLFPHLTEKININLTYLYSEILRLREEKVVVIPWDQYLKLASESGITDQEEVRSATAVLECRVSLLFNGKAIYNIFGKGSSQHF